MSYETILVEREGNVATLTLNRPDKLNALNATVIEELDVALRELDADASVRVLIITGAGEKAFAAGADIAAMANMSVDEARAFAAKGQATCARFESVRFPVIGAINGFALGGGCEIALSCDFLYASDKAKLGQPEVNLGVTPGFGGTQRLARRVGVGLARELCMTGNIINAQEALRIGLVNAIVPAAELMAKVREVAKTIAGKGPLAVAQCKRVILSGADLPLARANALEADAFSSLFASSDQKEGMAAFLAKRPAEFSGT